MVSVVIMGPRVETRGESGFEIVAVSPKVTFSIVLGVLRLLVLVLGLDRLRRVRGSTGIEIVPVGSPVRRSLLPRGRALLPGGRTLGFFERL